MLKFNLIQIQGLSFLVIAYAKCVDVLTTGIFSVLEYFQNFSFNLIHFDSLVGQCRPR